MMRQRDCFWHTLHTAQLNFMEVANDVGMNITGKYANFAENQTQERNSLEKV